MTSNTKTNPLLQIQNLTRRYPSPDSDEPLTVFENANFDIQRGEFVCIIGHSGCGKSTIMNVLAGLDTATSGAVIMDGKEISGPSLDRGVVFQNYSLLPWMTALKNVMFGVRARHPQWSRKQVRDHSYEYLNMVGLGEGAEKRKPSQLSGRKRRYRYSKTPGQGRYHPPSGVLQHQESPRRFSDNALTSVISDSSG